MKIFHWQQHLRSVIASWLQADCSKLTALIRLRIEIKLVGICVQRPQGYFYRGRKHQTIRSLNKIKEMHYGKHQRKKLCRRFDGFVCCRYEDKQKGMGFHEKKTLVKSNVHFIPKNLVLEIKTDVFSSSWGVCFICENKIRRCTLLKQNELIKHINLIFF